MDMSLSKLQEMMDREAWHAAVHGHQKSDMSEWLDNNHKTRNIGFPGGSVVKSPPAVHETQRMQVRSLGQEDPLEAGTATHSSVLAWRTPWTEESGRL